MISDLQKASIITLLSTIDKDIEFTRYNIKKAKNSSLYNVKAKDNFNHYLDFKENNNYDNAFRDVVRFVYNKNFNQDYPLEYFSDGFCISCVVDILNEYLNETEYEKQQANFDYLNNIADNLGELYSTHSNYATNEPIVLQIAGEMCEELQAYIVSNDKCHFSSLIDTLNNFETEASENLKNHIIRDKVYWLKRPDKASFNNFTNLNRAKILTLALLSKDIYTEIFMATRYDNILGAKFTPSNPNFQNRAFNTYFFNKKHAEINTMQLRDDFCNFILDTNGFSNLKSSKINNKESLVFEIIKENLHSQGYIDRNLNEMKANNLFECYNDVLQKINFGPEQDLFSAVVLNIACTQGDTGVAPDLSDLTKYTAEQAFEIFNQNYHLVENNPTITLQAIKNLQKNKRSQNSQQNDENSTFDDFIKFMNNKNPNMRIIHVDMNNPDNIPPFIKDMLENLGILPTENDETPDTYDPDDDDTDSPNI